MGERRTVFILVLVLCFVVISIPQIEVVRAQGTIYIRADGSVEGTEKIHREGNIYTFSDNINAEIIVEIDDIVIDGADYSLQGNGGGAGIYVPNNGNLEIKNIKIHAFQFAILLGNFYHFSTNNSIISGNTLTNNAQNGIYITNSFNNSIFGNYIEKSGTGIELVECYNNAIFQNRIVGNSEGVSSGSGGGYNTLYHNLIADNVYAFKFGANSDNTFYGNNLINNTNLVNDPYFFWVSSFNWDYRSMGNYWSDYNGTDNDGDGIGDTPYIINEVNQDNYPLMEPVDDTSIPEFPSAIILLLFVTVTLVVIIYRNRLRIKLAS